MNNEIMKQESTTLSNENVRVISAMVQEMMRPILESVGELLKHNTEAMEQIAASQKLTSDRIEALEKQVRLNTPMSSQQVKYLNDAIRDKARELLDKKDLANDKKAVTKLSGMIRKEVLSRYGVGGLRDIPKHEYSVAMNQIGMWNNVLAMKDIVREARERAEQNRDRNGPRAHLDGQKAHEQVDHQ